MFLGFYIADSEFRSAVSLYNAFSGINGASVE
jgi:hypothetical protein